MGYWKGTTLGSITVPTFGRRKKTMSKRARERERERETNLARDVRDECVRER